MNRVLIAQVAHNINQALRGAIGEAVEPWADASPEHKASILAGVDMHIANPDTDPETAHDAWLLQKTSEGWTFGEVKDAEAKTHPCMLPYADLPADQKIKDHLFRAVVHSLKGIPDANAPAPDRLLLPVKYIGPREHYVDGTYSTYINFTKGETRMVPADVARKMYSHPDVYVPGDIVADVADVKPEPSKEDTLQDMRDSIASMNKDAVANFVKSNFNQEVDKRQSVAAIRSQAIGLVDQFGIP